MSVKVNINQDLQQHTAKQEVVEVSGNTVGQCLADLVQQFPNLKSELFGKDGKLLEYIEIYVNRESAYPEELAKPVSDGDELSIIQMIFGG
jgi:molybdopterin converting factor small subunit